MNSRNLGAAVSELIRNTIPDFEYDIEADCNGLIGGYQARLYDDVARRYGFADRHALLDEVARRTSDRWVHFHIQLC